MIVEKDGKQLNIHPSKLQTFLNSGWKEFKPTKKTEEVKKDGDI